MLRLDNDNRANARGIVTEKLSNSNANTRPVTMRTGGETDGKTGLSLRYCVLNRNAVPVTLLFAQWLLYNNSQIGGVFVDRELKCECDRCF